MATALLTSLALALTWTPTLSHYLLRSNAAKAGTKTAASNRLTRFYERALRFTLALVLWRSPADALVLVVASYFCYNALGSDLLPAMDEGGFILDYLMPAGSSLADTNEVLLGVEKILAKTPEVESTSRRTGLQLGLAAVTEANTGDFLGEAEAQAQPRRSTRSLPTFATRSTTSIRSSMSSSSRCCRT